MLNSGIRCLRAGRPVALLLLIICLQFVSFSMFAAGPHARAPNWTLSDPVGASVDYYTDTKNAVSVILFWATWCPYCRSLMRYIQEVADEFRDRPVNFYALNVWEDGDPEKYMQENSYSSRLLLLADLVAEDYGVKGTPGLMVMDADHNIRYVRQPSEEDVEVRSAMREAIIQALVVLKNQVQEAR